MINLEENKDQSVTAHHKNNNAITFYPKIDLDLSVQLLQNLIKFILQMESQYTKTGR